MVKPTVFISYAREDAKFAIALYEALEAEFSPWMDKRNLIGGEDWERAITLAVNKCDFFIFCASTKSVNKRGAIQKEIRLALEVWREKLQDDIYCIPIRLEDCDVPESLCQFQWIDGFEPGWINSVLHSLRVGTQRVFGFSSPLPLAVDKRSISSPPSAPYSLSVAYPEFHPADSRGMALINAYISVYARKAASNFEIPEWISIPVSGSLPNSLHMNFVVDGISANLISMRFSRSIYTGGAHPNHSTEALNFSRDPVREIELEHFASSQDAERFLGLISELCTDNIIRQRTAMLGEINRINQSIDPTSGSETLDLTWTRDGLRPDWGNFRAFTLNETGFTFFFDPYHVGSYAEGRYEAHIRFDLVNHLVKPSMRDLFVDIHKGTEEA